MTKQLIPGSNEIIIQDDGSIVYAKPPAGAPADWNTLSNKPTLGTAAAANLATTTTAGASEVVLGNDTRMSNARTPLTHSHAPADVTGTAVITADSRLSDARTPLTHSHAPADVTGTAVITSDSRLSDARTPTTHSHAEADVTNLVTDLGNKLAASVVVQTNSKTERLGGNFGIAWAQYSFGTDGGLVSTITPPAARNTTIPANAILVGSTINVTTAVTSSGSATMAIGCAGTGGSTSTLLAATAKTSLTLNAVLAGAKTFAAPTKLTGAGGITFTIAAAALTAGVIEVFVLYWVAA